MMFSTRRWAPVLPTAPFPAGDIVCQESHVSPLPQQHAQKKHMKRMLQFLWSRNSNTLIHLKDEHPCRNGAVGPVLSRLSVMGSLGYGQIRDPSSQTTDAVPRFAAPPGRVRAEVPPHEHPLCVEGEAVCSQVAPSLRPYKLYRQARQQKGSNNKNFPC